MKITSQISKILFVFKELISSFLHWHLDQIIILILKKSFVVKTNKRSLIAHNLFGPELASSDYFCESKVFTLIN